MVLADVGTHKCNMELKLFSFLKGNLRSKDYISHCVLPVHIHGHTPFKKNSKVWGLNLELNKSWNFTLLDSNWKDSALLHFILLKLNLLKYLLY